MKTDIKGKLINNFEDYKKYVANKYTSKWLKATEKEVYKVFGEPINYPCIFIEIDKAHEDSAYESTQLVKVYF